MTNPDYTHILAIVDRSGSMATSKAVMEDALNEFFYSQTKLDGKCLVDYVQFDDNYDVVYTDTPVDDARAFIEPRGLTALLDGIGKGTIDLGKKLALMSEDERPGKVLVVVVTDGAENASREFSVEAVNKLVTEQQDKWNWDYVFLGANIDAVATGTQYGFKGDKSLTFNIHSGESVIATSAALSGYTTAYRGGGDAKFSDEDRRKAVDNSQSK